MEGSHGDGKRVNRRKNERIRGRKKVVESRGKKKIDVRTEKGLQKKGRRIIRGRKRDEGKEKKGKWRESESEGREGTRKSEIGEKGKVINECL